MKDTEFIEQIDFEKGDGLLPAIVQDSRTRKVLMLGYMNKEALKKTLWDKQVTFYSRSKERLWTKGETSGNFLILERFMIDCDRDTILLQVQPLGPVCHTGSDTCFDEKNQGNFLEHLEAVIRDRKENPSEHSYTSRLLSKGINKVAQKVGEEAVELIIEAKDEDKGLFLNEAADLMYHFLVLLSAKGYRLTELMDVLRERHE